MTAWGQFLLLPHRNVAGRFTSISRHIRGGLSEHIDLPLFRAQSCTTFPKDCKTPNSRPKLSARETGCGLTAIKGGRSSSSRGPRPPSYSLGGRRTCRGHVNVTPFTRPEEG
jgi:hypothetical protein